MIAVLGQPRSAPAPVGSNPEPTPSGTIIWDSRAGGAQDMQAMTSLSDFDAALSAMGGGGIQSGTYQSAAFAFASDYNGAGKKALRVDYAQNIDAQSNATALMYFYSSGSYQTYQHLYMSVVIHLGNTATGGGAGSVGAFTVPGADSITKLKRILSLRAKDNGSNRLDWDWGEPGTDPAFAAHFEVPDLSYDLWYPLDYGLAVDVRWTFEYLGASTSVANLWRDGVIAYTNTNAGIGTGGFAQIEFPTNRWNVNQAENEFWTDLVVWST